MRTLTLLPLLAIAGAAHADDIVEHDSYLLQTVADTVYEHRVGHPTVAYDADSSLWVMYFEVEFARNGDADLADQLARVYGENPPDAALCGPGVNWWGVGRATSTDGLTWTYDEDLVVSPVQGTWYECLAAQPHVQFDGTTWHMWFKAQQRSDRCGDPDVPDPEIDYPDGDTGTATNLPSWGCEDIPGFGYASSTDGVSWTVSEEPAMATPGGGTLVSPSVHPVGSGYDLMFSFNSMTEGHKLWRSQSSSMEGPWSEPELLPVSNTPTWGEDLQLKPSLRCELDELDEAFLRMTAGGRTEGVWSIGSLTTADDAEWTFADDADFTWEAGTTQWSHWEAVNYDGTNSLYFFSQTVEGTPSIGLAYDLATAPTSLDGSLLVKGACPTAEPVDTGDTGDTADTGDTGPEGHTDTGMDTDATDPGGDDDDKDCGCQTGGGSLWLGLLPLGLIARRRRQG